MKIILKSKIKKLGNIGDVVDVKDGYGRNMLIPNNLAIFYTDKNYEIFKVKKAEIEKKNTENKVTAEELKNKISEKEIILIENAGDDGKLYGSISSVKIANFINSLLKINDIKKSNIFLKEPIKNVGKHIIIIELHPEVSFEKDLIIARTKEEANKIKKSEFEIKKDSNKNDLIQTDLEKQEEESQKIKNSRKKESEKTDKTEEIK